MFYDSYYKIFSNLKNQTNSHAAKQEIASKCLRYFWPDYNVVWINSVSVYDNIERVFRAFPKKRNLIILQTEEDFLKHYNISYLRNKIKNTNEWTSNSFLITNCYQDYKISKDIIPTVFKPGLLDLLCYQPYEQDIVKLHSKKIKFHTGFHYQRKDRARDYVADFLSNNKENVSSLIYNSNRLVSNITDIGSVVFDKKDPVDPPFIGIWKDSLWSDCAAFHTVIEPINCFSVDEKLYSYTPILSEKTFKAIHLLRPALIYSGPGTQEYLKRLGFDTWDWLIDWRFDKETDQTIGFHLFLKELQRLCNTDIRKIQQLIKDNEFKLLDNRKILFNLINNYSHKL